MKIWQIDTLENGQIELTAPNGTILFSVAPDTTEMLGQMLLDESYDASEDRVILDEREEMTIPLSQRAAQTLEQLNYELKEAGESAYKQSVTWTRFARRAEPVLRELAQMILPKVVRGSIRPEVLE